MNIFPFKSEEITENEIRDLISGKTEESINLDFKEARALKMGNEEKREISKDVSAFANSGGGTIIYGVTEKDNKADSMSPIDGNTYTKEWLEQVINSNIQRRIEGVKIVPIRIDGDILKTIYVVSVPESDNAPHIAADKKFYKRFNFESVRMEEYEIRHLYNRIGRTRLRIWQTLIENGSATISSQKIHNIEYTVRFQVENIGMSIENQYKLEMSIPKKILHPSGITSLMKYHQRTDGEYAVFSIPNNSPLFQGEVTTVGSVYVILNKQSFASLSVSPILLKLYYSNGVDEIQPDLTAMLTFEGGLLRDQLFH